MFGVIKGSLRLDAQQGLVRFSLIFGGVMHVISRYQRIDSSLEILIKASFTVFCSGIELA